MSTVAELRAKIEARRTVDVARVPICIDRAQAQQITTLEAELVRLAELREATLAKAKEDSQRGDHRLGDSPVTSVDQQIKTAEADLDTAWTDAEDDTLIIVLNALPGSGEGSYQALIDNHAEEFSTDDTPTGFCEDLVGACYLRAETTGGDNLGYTWDELRPMLYHGDWERVWREAILHNRRSPQLDFSKRRSVSRRRAAK